MMGHPDMEIFPEARNVLDHWENGTPFPPPEPCVIQDPCFQFPPGEYTVLVTNTVTFRGSQYTYLRVSPELETWVKEWLDEGILLHDVLREPDFEVRVDEEGVLQLA